MTDVRTLEDLPPGTGIELHSANRGHTNDDGPVTTMTREPDSVHSVKPASGNREPGN